MDIVQKLFENIFIEDKNSNKIIHRVWCLLILSSRKESITFGQQNAPKVRTFRSGLRNNKRNGDLLPHVSRRRFDKDAKLTYYMHEMISMGRVDRIFAFETVVAEEGRERREWSRSAFSCSLTNRSPVVLRTSHRSHLPAPRRKRWRKREESGGDNDDEDDDGNTTKDCIFTHTLIFSAFLSSPPSPQLYGYPRKNFANDFETSQVCSHLGYRSQFAMTACKVREQYFRRTLALYRKKTICTNFGIVLRIQKLRRESFMTLCFEMLNFKSSFSYCKSLRRFFARINFRNLFNLF